MEKAEGTIVEFIRNRLSSAAIAAYGFFWLLIHAQGVYATFFVNQDLIYKKYGLLKNEYVYRYFFGCHRVALFGYGEQHAHHVYFVNWQFFWGLLLPAILTYVYIWWLPKLVLMRAYEEEQKHKTAKKKFRFKQEQEVVEFEKETAEKKTDAVEAEIVLAQKVQEAEDLDPGIAWTKDFEEFKKGSTYYGFSDIIDAYYDHAGHAKRYFDRTNSTWTEPGVSSDILAIADSNELITLDTKTNTFELTPKGRYFVKRFQSEH